MTKGDLETVSSPKPQCSLIRFHNWSQSWFQTKQGSSIRSPGFEHNNVGVRSHVKATLTKMPVLFKIGVILGGAYVLLDRPQVMKLARIVGYGLGRSVGMLRNYRQNAEKLVKASPDGQKGVMGSMRDLDTVAREIRMAVWMARPGAMMRMGPMGTMGMTITPPVGNQPLQMAGQQQYSPQNAQSSMANISSMSKEGVAGPHSNVIELPGGEGSDYLVSSWRSGVERMRVLKRT